MAEHHTNLTPSIDVIKQALLGIVRPAVKERTYGELSYELGLTPTHIADIRVGTTPRIKLDNLMRAVVAAGHTVFVTIDGVEYPIDYRRESA